MFRPTALALAVTVLTAHPMQAEIPGIQNHKVQLLFMENPCTAVMKTIDDAKTLFEIADAGLAFGFLMGFEATHPGIRGDQQTVLMRLREDCTPDDTRTAMEILQGYAAELLHHAASSCPRSASMGIARSATQQAAGTFPSVSRSIAKATSNPGRAKPRTNRETTLQSTPMRSANAR